MDIFPKFFHLPATTSLQREPEFRPYKKWPGFVLPAAATWHGEVVEIGPEKPRWYGFVLLGALVVVPVFLLAVFIKIPLIFLVLWGTVHPAVAFFLWRAYLWEYAGGPYTLIDFGTKEILYPRVGSRFSFERIQAIEISWLLLSDSDSSRYIYYLIAVVSTPDENSVLVALAFADAASLLKKAHKIVQSAAREHGVD